MFDLHTQVNHMDRRCQELPSSLQGHPRQVDLYQDAESLACYFSALLYLNLLQLFQGEVAVAEVSDF